MSAFAPIINALNQSGVSYVVVGGLATVLYGHLRVTADVDLVVRLVPQNVSSALTVLHSLGFQPRMPVDPSQFADEKIRQTWVREKGMTVFSFFDPQDVTRSVDLFADYPMDYEELFARSELKEIGGISMRVCALDDLIAMKRAADRPIDREDVKALEAIRKNA